MVFVICGCVSVCVVGFVMCGLMYVWVLLCVVVCVVCFVILGVCILWVFQCVVAYMLSDL